MTDEAKALVERLRNTICHGDMGCERLIADDEAADLIETQAREIERLREALEAISNMYPDWASERMALVRKRAKSALGEQ